MASPRILIIGAGAAGIAAGTKLYENGIKNITWLEAEPRIGGRLHTVEFGANVIDFGAQWCHGEKKNVVYDLAYPLGLLQSSNHIFIDPKQVPEFVTSSGESLIAKKKDIAKIIYHLNLLTHDDLSEVDGSLGDYMNAKFAEKLQTDLKGIDRKLCHYVFEWYHKVENSLEASDSWFETSAKRLMEYWVCEGDHNLNWKRKGYSYVLDLLMKENKPQICKKILLNKIVTNVNWGNKFNGAIEVRCKDGTVYEGDHVIVTVSLGVLKQQAHQIFNPELPLQKMNAINGFNIGTVDKLIFEYPYQWWPSSHNGFSFVWNKEDKDKICKKIGGSIEENSWLFDVFGFYPIDHQPNILLGWVGGASARKMEALPEFEVKKKLCHLIEMFINNKFDVPRPVRFVRSTWDSNPHFRGSYSFRSLTSEQMGVTSADLAFPLKNNEGKEFLHFAGEATHDHYFSTVHGAIETGWREADRIMSIYRLKLTTNGQPCSKI